MNCSAYGGTGSVVVDFLSSTKNASFQELFVKDIPHGNNYSHFEAACLHDNGTLWKQAGLNPFYFIDEMVQAQTSLRKPVESKTNVLIFLMDALSRDTMHSVLDRLTLKFSEMQSWEYEGLSTTNGANSDPNWGALFCNDYTSTNCTKSLIDKARLSGYYTLFLNNYIGQYPCPWQLGPHTTFIPAFTDLDRPDLGHSCTKGNSIQTSWMRTFTDVVKASSTPVFGVIAPHQAHNTDLTMLKQFETELLKTFDDMYHSDLWRSSVVIFIADHGLHYDSQSKSTDPGELYSTRDISAAAAHRNPVLYILNAFHLGYSLSTYEANRGALISMHDVYTTIDQVLSNSAGNHKSSAQSSSGAAHKYFDLLTEVVPINRTCADASISTFCNCWVGLCRVSPRTFD